MHIIFLKRFFIFLLIVLFGNATSFSQGWFRSYGGTGTETSAGVVISGNDYIHVATTSSYGAGQTDIMVVKTDSLGRLIWQHVIGTPAIETAKGIVCSPTGEIYIAGDVDGISYKDILLLKLDTAGNLIWSKTFPGSSCEVASGIAISDSCIAISCNISPQPYGPFDISVLGVDSAGIEIWSKLISVSGSDRVNSISKVHDGGFIIGGIKSTLPNDRGFIVRLNSEGDSLWSVTLPYYISLRVESCTQLQGDSLFAIGAGWYTVVLRLDGTTKSFINNASGDTEGIAACFDGGFALISKDNRILYKYNHNGVLQWSNSFYFTAPTYLKQTNDGGFIISGNAVFASDSDNLLAIKVDNNGHLNTFSGIIPSITTSSYPRCLGDTAIFTVPGGYDSYQWYNLSGNPIIFEGETDSILTVIGSITNYNCYCIMTLGNDIIVSKMTSVTFLRINTPQITSSGPVNFCAASTANTLSYYPSNYHTYQWNRDGIPIIGANGSSYNITASGNYTVTATHACGSVISNVVAVNANTPPNAVLTNSYSETISVCVSGQNCLPANPLQAQNLIGHSYNWLFNGVPTGANSYQFYPFATGNTYQVVVTNSCGSDTSSNGTHSNFVMNCSIYATGLITGCGTDTAVLRPSTGYFDSYQWYKNGIPIAGATLDSLVVTSGGSYYCEVSEMCDWNLVTGYSNTIAFNPNINPLPTISSSGNTVICSGTVQLSASISGGTYQWYRNSSSINGANAQSYLADTSGSYYCKITTATCGLVNSNIIQVRIGVPEGIIQCNNTNICQGNSTYLTLSSSNHYSTYSTQWRKDGVNIQGANSTSFSASAQGIYDCMMINLCDTFITNSITINVLTISIVPTGPLNICDGDSVLLSATTGPGYTYTWHNGSTAIPGATSSFYYANSTQYYKVHVNTGSCYIISAYVHVQLNSLPEANIWSSTYPALCSNDSVLIHANNRPDYLHQWYFNNQLLAVTTSAIYATTSGNYKVNILDSLGCESTSPEFVINNNTLGANTINTNPYLPFCEGDTIELFTSFPASNYQWFANNQLLPGANNQSYSVNQSGYYSVEFTNAVGCFGEVSEYINIIQPPPFLPFVTPEYCGNSNGWIYMSEFPTTFLPYTYQWSNGDSTNSVYGVSTGTYWCTITNTAGCYVSDSINVPNASNLSVSATTPNDSICAGDSTSISVNGHSGSNFLWNTGALSSSIITDTSGLYIVTVTDTTGCSGSDTILITVNSLPIVNLSASGPITFCQGDSVVLNASAGFASYVWLRRGSIIPGQNAQTYTAKIGGRYSCIVTNNFGCFDTSGTLIVSVPCVPVGPPVDKIQSGVLFTDLNIFPNPAKELLHIHFVDDSESIPDLLLSISDVNGKIILKQKYETGKGKNEFLIDLKSFAPGMYFLSLITADKQTYRKFVVE